MTIKHFLLNSVTFFIGILLFTQCKKYCGQGYINVDRDCICPEGKFEAYGKCRELKSKEFYGTLDDCPCNDTLFFEIAEHSDYNLLYFANYKAIGMQTGTMEYFIRQDGDSIAGVLNDRVCEINGIRCEPFWMGKYVNGNLINVTVLYFDLRYPPFEKPALDTCKFVLRR